VTVSCVDNRNNNVVASGTLCASCFDLLWEDFLEKRKQFEELIVSGVDRKAANDIMIARMDHEAVS
jgi:hypothetical protein